MPNPEGSSVDLPGNEMTFNAGKINDHSIFGLYMSFYLKQNFNMPQSGKTKQTCISLFLFLIVFSSYSQTLKDHLSKGDRYFQKKDYENALINYLEALSLDGQDAQTNFKVGISYWNEKNFGPAVAYLEKAYHLNPAVDPDIDYHLGMAYQENHQYTNALKHFESLRATNKKLSVIAHQKIKECSIADSLMGIPVKVDIQPLAGTINTPFSEYYPLITSDGKTLIFTSNRSVDEYSIKSATNFADVYTSRKQGTEWSIPEKISAEINVKLNEAATSLSADGKTLFLYYEEGNGDIYTATLENGAWTLPVPLNKFVNHPQYRESSACISPDGTKLFFSSNRPGGKGGYDLYVCELGSNGQWGRPANLGSAINTRRNEESPFLHSDGTTLYFSSNGHPTLGKSDIFKSTYQNGKWTRPENLGFPINSSSEEGYFVLSTDNKTGYYARRQGKGAGNLDIYSVDFSPSMPVAQEGESRPAPGREAERAGLLEGNKKIVTLLKGSVVDARTSEALEATVRLVDNSNRNIVANIGTDSSGKFELIITQGGNYGLTTEKKGYLFNSMNFNLPAFEKYQEMKTHILMVKAEVGSKAVLKNIFFDANQSVLKNESRAELEKIYDLLLENPQRRIRINGHTDNIGQPKTNLLLSLKRAEAVVQYLLQAGIAPDRLQAKGYGSERPLVSNDDEQEGRQINRRTEIEIIE